MSAATATSASATGGGGTDAVARRVAAAVDLLAAEEAELAHLLRVLDVDIMQHAKAQQEAQRTAEAAAMLARLVGPDTYTPFVRACMSRGASLTPEQRPPTDAAQSPAM